MSAGTRSTLLSANHPAPSGGCGHARNQAEPLTDADVLGVTGIPREERPSLVSGPTHGPHHPPSLSLGRPPRSRQQTARPLGAVDLGRGNTRLTLQREPSPRTVAGNCGHGRKRPHSPVQERRDQGAHVREHGRLTLRWAVDSEGR